MEFALLIAVSSTDFAVPWGFVTPSIAFVRGALTFLVLGTLAVVIFTAIHFLVAERSRKLGARKYWFPGACLLAILVLYLIHKPAEAALTVVAGGLYHLIPIGYSWVPFFVGSYYSLIATLALVVLIQAVGELFWFNQERLERWHRRRVSVMLAGSIRYQIYRSLSFLNRAFRVAALAVLVVVFLTVLFHFFPLTRGIVQYLRGPAISVAQGIVNYLPHVAYLFVIAVFGWATIKLLRFVFDSLKFGTLVFPGFERDWAQPTFNLLRALVLIFLLMVSYPHLPGASSEFFRGFSVFIGALVTFGSAGSVNNLVSGIVLTYTSAFRVGEMVRIGEATGIVLAKTLLVTRIQTPLNEEVSLPNSLVLSSSIINFTRRAASGGLALTVDAGIGYDVDWRTVHALMIDGAKKSEHILTEPAPIVLQSKLGDYAVNYRLLAWTDQPEKMVLINSELRRNVLDCFNAAGVEIMTPSVLAHRDASETAIPPERLQQPATPKRVAVDLRESDRTVSHSQH